MSDPEDAAAAHARRQREAADAMAAVAGAEKAAADQALEVRLRHLAGPGREFFALARRRGAVEFPLHRFGNAGYVRVSKPCVIARPWVGYSGRFDGSTLNGCRAVTGSGVFYGEARIHQRRDFNDEVPMRDDVFVVGSLAGRENGDALEPALVPLVTQEELVAAAAALLESVPVTSHFSRGDRTGIQKDGLIGYLRWIPVDTDHDSA